MDKLAFLSANVDQAFKVNIIRPGTLSPVVDKKGNPAYIEVYSTDSETSLKIDNERQQLLVKAARSGIDAPITGRKENLEKLAALTKSWYLVDGTGEPIDHPCTPENVKTFYLDPGKAWLANKVWEAASNPANFMKPLSDASSDMASTSGAEAAS